MLCLVACVALQVAQDSLTYIGNRGPGKGKHIVFLAGDEEYRSEEGLPQLARILAFRHGFKCTVLFSINKQGEIDPNTTNNQPGMKALESADLCIMLLRFRQWPASQMSHFVNYFFEGNPIIALRTSTHAFNYPPDSSSPFAKYSWDNKDFQGGFGKQMLGETWVSHWGIHGEQATRGVIEATAINHPILKGVSNIFGTTDVYEATPPVDAEILVNGAVVAGMKISDPRATNSKKTAQGVLQPVNDPMMPIVWLCNQDVGPGKVSKILTCTMGAATDLLNEGLRRLLVNGAYWAVGMEKKIPNRANVDFVGKYEPSPFGFEGFRKGVKPKDLIWPQIRR